MFKKWLPWIIGALLVGLLFLRLFYMKVNGLVEEEQWYVSELKYDFSARIDSMSRPRRGLMTITRGEVNARHELYLGEKLKAHGELRLLRYSKPYFEMYVGHKAQVGDSVCINSDEDRIEIYRNGQPISKHLVSEFLVQDPF